MRHGFPLILVPVEKHGCIVFSDRERQIHDEELTRGADVLVRHFMQSLGVKRSTLCISNRPIPALETLLYVGTSHDGWPIYRHETLSNLPDVELCPVLATYFDPPPQRLWFTARVPVNRRSAEASARLDALQSQCHSHWTTHETRQHAAEPRAADSQLL